MASAKYLPASTGTRVIRPSLGKCMLDSAHLFLRQEIHHLVGVAPAEQQLCHHSHRAIDVVEKQLISGA
jgi:hypothetical protein